MTPSTAQESVSDAPELYELIEFAGTPLGETCPSDWPLHKYWHGIESALRELQQRRQSAPRQWVESERRQACSDGAEAIRFLQQYMRDDTRSPVKVQGSAWDQRADKSVEILRAMASKGDER